ncbi:SH3 domain-containing protein [Rugamonas sp. CCM 8940]|uniref:SH3 domain-containing protein n=1 Tax=Rugamonas sp. CCM 8940 TaxID=2765359 RepID=UPI0018F76053|nr:SH3 domain-containing protein [Rugamonas sp. CCM 8940]MBJ7312845.1 SH3 domain-containing protein [Rugamonas sp. CCM 8940]
MPTALPIDWPFERLYSAGAFALGLLLTLFLAAYLTPRRWWQRPNTRALLILVVGAWGFGSLILFCARGTATTPALAGRTGTTTPSPTSTTKAAATAPPHTSPAGAPIAGLAFQVHRDLNLRQAAGVQTARLLTVPAGASVTPTGLRDGDWWQVRVHVGGEDKLGWANSLWLRSSGE